jgi:hypothetical protein
MKNTVLAVLLMLAPTARSQMTSGTLTTLARDQYVNISRGALQLLKPCGLVATSAATQPQNQAWQSVVYADWDRSTGTSSLRVHDFLLQKSGESRQFVFGSLWQYNVSLQKWERVNLRVNQPIVLKGEKRHIYSRESEQRIVRLTEAIGLLWAEWEEDGHRADTLVFAGPMLCEDVDIGNPPEGMIATCVPFANSAAAMFVPDPKIYCKR